jgi:hypothetical protein
MMENIPTHRRIGIGRVAEKTAVVSPAELVGLDKDRYDSLPFPDVTWPY